MTEYLLEMFGISLGLTLLFELPVGFLIGLRGWKNVTLMILINVLTNPPAVLACWLGVPQLPVEILVVVLEALIYLWFSRDEKWKISHPIALSITANALSWISGILIQAGGAI